MTRLTVLTAPDPLLKRKALPVAEVDDALRRFMDDMLETMYAEKGIGLAATQVGDLRRVIVMDLADKTEPPAPMFFVNPEVIWKSSNVSVFEEGCLSVPDSYGEVERPDSVTIRYLNRDNQQIEQTVDALFATCIQHEIDHLDGVLFIDHLSNLRRNMILKRLQKAKKMELLGEHKKL